jgi:hypothetical protein
MPAMCRWREKPDRLRSSHSWPPVVVVAGEVHWRSYKPVEGQLQQKKEIFKLKIRKKETIFLLFFVIQLFE